MKTITAFFITVLAMMCVSCTTQTLSDAAISTAVKGRLTGDSETSAIQIGVDTVNGVVTLSGVVPSDRERAKAELLARTTDGVRDVINNVTVNPDIISTTNIGEKTEEAVTDAALLTKIKAKLLAEGITGTNVDVIDAHVTLKGEVENA